MKSLPEYIAEAIDDALPKHGPSVISGREVYMIGFQRYMRAVNEAHAKQVQRELERTLFQDSEKP